MRHEIIGNRICFMLRYGFHKVEEFDNYVIADDKYYYPTEWIMNDYIFYYKICRLNVN